MPIGPLAGAGYEAFKAGMASGRGNEGFPSNDDYRPEQNSYPSEEVVRNPNYHYLLSFLLHSSYCVKN